MMIPKSIFDEGDEVSFTIYENDFIGTIEKVSLTLRDRWEYHIRGESTNHPSFERPKPIVTRMSHRPLTLVRKNDQEL